MYSYRINFVLDSSKDQEVLVVDNMYRIVTKRSILKPCLLNKLLIYSKINFYPYNSTKVFCSVKVCYRFGKLSKKILDFFNILRIIVINV